MNPWNLYIAVTLINIGRVGFVLIHDNKRKLYVYIQVFGCLWLFKVGKGYTQGMEVITISTCPAYNGRYGLKTSKMQFRCQNVEMSACSASKTTLHAIAAFLKV